jgi:Zn finger protein HypA/HybF involved in hydrogenase expression
MNNRRKSVIWSLGKEEFQYLIDCSTSKTDVLNKLKLNPYTGNHRTLNRRIDEENIDLTSLAKNSKQWRLNFNKQNSEKKKFSNDKVFVENSTYGRKCLKKRIIEQKLIEYKCSECKNYGEWENKKLVLILDHINGVNNDNRIENLRFLCPNCNSQTETFSGKNARLPSPICPSCSSEYAGYGKICNKCHQKNPKKKFEISKDDLQELITAGKSFEELGRKYGVSGNAIKKRCIKFGINWK